jgi:hypothetical protein
MKVIGANKPIFNEKDSLSNSYYGFILIRHWEVRGKLYDGQPPED